MFVEAIPNPLFWVDEHGNFQGCNELFSDILGLNSPQDILHTSKKQVFSDLGIRKADDLIHSLLTDKEQAGVLYDCIETPFNGFIWTQKRFTQIKNSIDSKIIGVLCMVFDISEQAQR